MAPVSLNGNNNINNKINNNNPILKSISQRSRENVPPDLDDTNIESRSMEGQYSGEETNLKPNTSNETNKLNNDPGSRLFKSKHLKELVLLQLDLIEEQQNKLTVRDKEILALKHERDQLEARVNRMERRIAVQKKHSLDGESKLKSPASTSIGNSHPKKEFAKPNNNEKLKIIQAPITVVSTHDREFQFHKHLRTNIEFLDNAKTNVGFTKCFLETNPSEENVLVPSFVNASGKKNPKELMKDDPDDNIEDISDDAYDKRHSKHEQDEKRRKRWDLQLLRQQRQQEILVQKYQDREGKVEVTTSAETKPPVPYHTDSLFKGTRAAMAIEISDEIPVCAFGYHLPATRERDFQLPWFSIAKKEIQMREAKQRLLKKQQQKCLRRKSARTDP